MTSLKSVPKPDTCKSCGGEVDAHGFSLGGFVDDDPTPVDRPAPTEEAKKALFIKAATDSKERIP